VNSMIYTMLQVMEGQRNGSIFHTEFFKIGPVTVSKDGRYRLEMISKEFGSVNGILEGPAETTLRCEMSK
jgi:hypothetical protein